MTRQSKSTPKKTATKNSRKASAKKPRPLTWRFYAVTIGIFLIAVTTVVVMGLFTANIVRTNTINERQARIQNIYASLNIGSDYQVERYDVFGEKRPYEWEAGRTYSSSIEYAHGDTVSNTVAELDTKIKAAGFTFIDEPYPGSTQTEYHYKSANGEYIRLSVMSKPYFDAVRNTALMKGEFTDEMSAMDKNAAPSIVTVKVNLDDNNE